MGDIAGLITDKTNNAPVIRNPGGAGIVGDIAGLITDETNNAPVIRNPGAPGIAGGIAGLNCHVMTSALSPQCHGLAGVLI